MREFFSRKALLIFALFLSLFFLPRQAPCEENKTLNLSEDNKPKNVYALSLEDTITIALKNNKDIQIQEQEVEYARANITAAMSRFLPAVSAGYDFTYTEAVYTTDSLPANRKDTRIFMGYKSSNELAFTGNQMIYDGGASIANLKQARINLKIQEETLRSRILEIEFEAKRLYYGLLLAYETLRITKYLVDQAQAHYENVKMRFEQGTSSKFDVLQSKVQVSLFIPQLVNAENSIELIAADIKKLLYINMQDDIEALGSLSYSPIEIKEMVFLNEAYSNNPQIKLKYLGVDLKKWAIEEAKSGWYPNINATANYNYQSDKVVDMINPRHDNYGAGISGTVSIFDGMSTKAKVDEAKARYTQAILGRENITEQIARDIKQGCLDMRESSAIILSQQDNLKEAKEALEISYISYDNGVGINLDVIDSQTALGQVEKNLASGMYDYLTARAYLDRTMGREYFAKISSGEGTNDKKR